MSVSVVDKKGVPVKGLTRSAFRVLDGKAEQEITSFESQDVPASVALILDPSSIDSAENRDPKRAKRLAAALARFAAFGHPSNEYFVIRLSGDGSVYSAPASDAEGAQAILRDADPSSFRGNARVVDAMKAGFDRVSQGTYPKQAAVVITDGEFVNSRTSYDEIFRSLEERNILAYVVVMTPENYSDEFHKSGTTSFVLSGYKNIAQTAGGMFLHAKRAEDAGAFMERAAADFRSRYAIQFVPLKAAPAGKCYSFKVKVATADGASVSVRSRDTFCPPR